MPVFDTHQISQVYLNATQWGQGAVLYMVEEIWYDYIWIFNADKALLRSWPWTRSHLLAVDVLRVSRGTLHPVGRSVRLHSQNNCEIHEFIILLWESSVWYRCVHALRRDSHNWLHSSWPISFFYVTIAAWVLFPNLLVFCPPPPPPPHAAHGCYCSAIIVSVSEI